MTTELGSHDGQFELDPDSYDLVTEVFDGSIVGNLEPVSEPAFDLRLQFESGADLFQPEHEFRYVIQTVDLVRGEDSSLVNLTAVTAHDNPVGPVLPRTITLQIAVVNGSTTISDLNAINKARKALVHRYLTLM